jgi:carbon dioxide concentrating mechanism protein CcmL
MRFARVIGTVVCTEKVPSWKGHRLLLLQPTDSQGADQGRRFVAVDLVSAAPGQWVFYVRARRRWRPDTDNPTDAAIGDRGRPARNEARARAVGRPLRPAPGPPSAAGAAS